MTRNVKLTSLLILTACINGIAKQKTPEATARVFKAPVAQVYAAAVQAASADFNLKRAVKEGHTVNFFYAGTRFAPDPFVLTAICTSISPDVTSVAVAVEPSMGNSRVFGIGGMRKKLREQFWDDVAIALKNMPTQPAPEDTAPAAPSEATITVMSTPGGSDVLVDGKFAGSTPSTLHVADGKHTITIEDRGYQDWERTLTLQRGDSITLNATLNANK
ncbi:MAG TPA: PEGA domain-containing protein [Terriglobia bacterium]|nr:PEGA domain-containing protein [Terriglobia bacterium]